MTKNQEHNIRFYMAEANRYVNNDGSVTYTYDADSIRDIEASFDGLTYSSAEGLNTKGKVKNAYTETYSDSDRLRVFFPEHPQREATKVKFTFVFVGENRYTTYDEFYEYITGGYRAYWDNKRKRLLYFFCTAEYKPAEEKWYGSTPYLKMTIEVNNIYGDTTFVEEL